MGVLLKAVIFNHDHSSATADALNIRKNNTEFIAGPEWQRGDGIPPKNSPAAYARDEVKTTITIKAQFRRATDSNLETVEICAFDGHVITPPLADSAGAAAGLAGSSLSDFDLNVLGVVKPRRVTFRDDGETNFEIFELGDVRLAQVGVSVSEVVWRWHFRRDSQSEWEYFDTSTHRIYTVLAVPACPWVQLPYEEGNTQLPWADVLDYACTWASSAQTLDDAATRVTSGLNALGQEGVFKHDGYPSFIGSKTDNFKCTEFLAALRRHGNPPALLNCSDCAAAVSSFSNILGCELSQSQMGYNFRTNDILRIGHPSPDHRTFFFHEVAWEGGATENDELFDACLNLDNDPSPTHFEPLLPVNILFGGHDRLYRDLLATPATRGRCEPQPDTSKRRIIGETPLKVKTVNQTQLEILASHYSFDKWSGENNSIFIPHPFIWKFSLRGDEIPGWRLEGLRHVEGAEGLPPSVQSTWRREGTDEIVNLDVYECETPKTARYFLLELLTDYQLLELELRLSSEGGGEGTVLGDVLLVDPEGNSLLFAGGNQVALVRKSEENSLDIFEFALLSSQYLTAGPDAER